MSEPELASRAPESDLYDEPLSNDKAPLPSTTDPEDQHTTQPNLSEHCTTDRPLPKTAGQEAPSGDLSKWHLPTLNSEVEVYISKPNSYPTSPARLLLLLTNGVGVHSPNNQRQADLFARHGYLTVMPDLFGGDPAPNSKPAENEQLTSESTWLDTVKLKVAETAKSFGLDMWLARHTPEKIAPLVTGVLELAKAEFADAVQYGGGVFGVGYCFGGRYVLLLAGGEAEAAIKAGICAHGTMVGREELKGVKAPVQLVCVEEDTLFPADVLEEGRKGLEERNVDHEVEIYKDVPHGRSTDVFMRFGVLTLRRFCCDGRVRVKDDQRCTSQSV